MSLGPCQELPRLVEGGEDAAQEASEEEFDLGEVLRESVSQGPAASADRAAAVEAELQASSCPILSR